MNDRLEFSRPLTASAIPPDGRTVALEATPAECAELARRFGLPAIAGLTASIELRPLHGGGFAARGSLAAEITQTCVVSLTDFPVSMRIPLNWRFVEEENDSDVADPDEPDDIPIEGETLELGEAAAQALALALDPYPRRPGAVLPAEVNDASAHPFAALKALKPEKD